MEKRGDYEIKILRKGKKLVMESPRFGEQMPYDGRCGNWERLKDGDYVVIEISDAVIT